MALASSTIFLLHVEYINIHEMKYKWHIVIMIKTDLFVVTMHSGLCEQYVQYLGVTHSQLLIQQLHIQTATNVKSWMSNYRQLYAIT